MVTIELRPLPGVGSGQRPRAHPGRLRGQDPRARVAVGPAALRARPAQPVALGTQGRGAPPPLPRRQGSGQLQGARLLDRRALPGAWRSAAARSSTRSTPGGTRYSQGAGDRLRGRPDGGRGVLGAARRSSGPVEGRNLVRFSPAVANLAFDLQGRTLEVTGDFAWDTLYSVSLAQHPLPRTSGGGRCEMRRPQRGLPALPATAGLRAPHPGHGLVERLGPQMVPVDGRGQERLDLRIHRIDPLDRSFWPFPDRPLSVDESERPPGPGEEPPRARRPLAQPHDAGAAAAPRTLGSPPVSTLVTPAPEARGQRRHLRPRPRAAPRAGLRRGTRPAPTSSACATWPAAATAQWMRLQVTDLSLSTVEEPTRVRFAVTSLSTGLPVAGARVRVEGTLTAEGDASWVTLAEGTTGPTARSAGEAPGYDVGVASTPCGASSWTKGDDVAGPRRHAAARPLRRQPVVEEPRAPGCSGRWSRSPGRGPQPRGARPPLHRAAGLSARGGGAHQGLPAHAGRGRLAPLDRRGLAGRRGPGRPRLALPGDAHRRRAASTTSSRRRTCPPASSPRHFEDQERKNQLRQRVLPHGGLPHPALRGAAPRSRQGAASTGRSTSRSPRPTTPAAGWRASPSHWRVTQFPYAGRRRSARASSTPPTAASRAAGASSRRPRSRRTTSRAPRAGRKVALEPDDRAHGAAAHATWSRPR